MTTVEQRVDPITFEVVTTGLSEVAVRMADALRRSAYSPIIHDGSDFSCAIIDTEYNVIAEVGCPIHIGTLPMSVRNSITEHTAHEPLRPGDILAVNDPYRGSVHLNDIAFLGGVFDGEQKVVAYVASRAHWPDVGGYDLAGNGAKDLWDEGIIIPPVKLFRQGAANQDLINLILENIRGRESGRKADLYAQVASLKTGLAGVKKMLDKYSSDVVIGCFKEAVRYADQRMRYAISQLPDGDYFADDVEDDTGISLEPVDFKVKVNVSGDSIRISYSGTGMQSMGPINSAWGMTLSATYIILKALLDPFGPAGCSWNRAITVDGPIGSMVNPLPGAAVFGGGIEVGPRICDLIMSALKDVIPERVTGAPYGTIDTSFISGTDPVTKDYWIYNDWIPGGWGGCHDHDGQNCMIILVANTDDIPIEICELKYPLRYRYSELIPDSGGAGKFRGGLGVMREVEVLGPQARASIQADRTRTAPWGIFGGGPASRTRYSVIRPDGATEVIGGLGPDGSYQSAKKAYNLKHGEILRIESAGGGGYGDPKERDRELVRDDVRKGYVSEQAASSVYDLVPTRR